MSPDTRTDKKGQPMNVLLIDDEPDIRKFYDTVLRGDGIEQIESVGSGEEAVSLVLRAKFDLILLDIAMPGLSGLEIISILRNMCPHALIAIISGHIPDHIPSEVLDCADALMNKPIALDTLTNLGVLAARKREIMDEVRRMSDSELMLQRLADAAGDDDDDIEEDIDPELLLEENG